MLYGFVLCTWATLAMIFMKIANAITKISRPYDCKYATTTFLSWISWIRHPINLKQISSCEQTFQFNHYMRAKYFPRFIHIITKICIFITANELSLQLFYDTRNCHTRPIKSIKYNTPQLCQL